MQIFWKSNEDGSVINDQNWPLLVTLSISRTRKVNPYIENKGVAYIKKCLQIGL